ncbi:MAG: hypothetical protein LIO71_00705 [Ruminococcus sp.]|nr:hypothetical protein [Ruminococcus sp.]MCD7799657.1 hypothetical protein [Ruminococcus sp.]
MKILVLDSIPFMYPQGVSSLDEFMDFANKNFYMFIPMSELSMKNCVYPYFVEDDIFVRYVNLSLVKSFFEDDVEIISRLEYDERLEDLQEEICINCKHYFENFDGDNLEGHRDEMRLDGYCPNFTPLDSDGDDFDYDEDEEF